MKYPTEKYNRIVDETYTEIRRLSKLKGGEYAAEDDRLDNFRRNGEALNLTKEQVWGVYAAKHWDALNTYIKDTASGKKRERLESISGRCDDLIVYLLLMKAMIDENTHVPLPIPKVNLDSLHQFYSPADERAKVNSPWPKQQAPVFVDSSEERDKAYQNTPKENYPYRQYNTNLRNLPGEG